MSVDILPDCRARRSVGEVEIDGITYVQVYCMNCGRKGPVVTKENCTFAGYLCTPCSETWGNIAGTYMMPDQVFFQKCAEAEMEKYGRVLTDEEKRQAMDDPHGTLSKLNRDRQRQIRGLK